MTFVFRHMFTGTNSDCFLNCLKCLVQVCLEEENTKAFLILNEIILTLKNVRAT